MTAWILYNIYLHPLSHVPGPFWDRATGIPSWYATIQGRRHVYLSRQFDLYGDRIRPEPGTVLFRGPAAHADIYGARSNVRRSCFYRAFNRTKKIDETTFTTTDVAAHARKRRVLNVCFTERLVKAAAPFIVRHVDRWVELLAGEGGGWSPAVDFSVVVDALIFDIMGDLSFGRSFDIKEGGENSVKEVPDCISSALQFYYPVSMSFVTLYLSEPMSNHRTDLPIALSQALCLAEASRPRQSIADDIPADGAQIQRLCMLQRRR